MVPCHTHDRCLRPYWTFSTVTGLDTFDLEKKNLLQVQVDRKLQSPRGTIYDRNGKPLAMSVVTKSLYADPKMIKQSPQRDCGSHLTVCNDVKENIVKALQEDTAFVWLNRMMDADKSKASTTSY